LNGEKCEIYTNHRSLKYFFYLEGAEHEAEKVVGTDYGLGL
jgi:hypothetical protein